MTSVHRGDPPTSPLFRIGASIPIFKQSVIDNSTWLAGLAGPSTGTCSITPFGQATANYRSMNAFPRNLAARRRNSDRPIRHTCGGPFGHAFRSRVGAWSRLGAGVAAWWPMVGLIGIGQAGGFEGFFPASESAADGQGVGAVFKTDFGPNECLAGGLALFEPQHHRFQIEMLWPAARCVGQIDARG